MRVLACVKRVPAPGAKINIANDGLAVDTAFLGFAVSPHEECAVEAAISLVEAHGGESVVLTVGPPEAVDQLRDSVSRGAQRIVLVPTDGTDWDPQRTAAAITDAIRTIEATDGPFDLILFGNESADSGGFQVGIRVAHALDRPAISGAKGLEVAGPEDGAGAESDSVTVRREFEGGIEVYQLPMPAVVAVKEGINLPRYPTMRGRVASRKAEVLTIETDAAAGGQALVTLVQPPEQVSNTVNLGSGTDSVPAIVDLMEELGLL